VLDALLGERLAVGQIVYLGGGDDPVQQGPCGR